MVGHLLRHRKVRKSLFLRELPLQRLGGVVGTENLGRQPRHEGLQVLVQDAAKRRRRRPPRKHILYTLDTWYTLSTRRGTQDKEHKKTPHHIPGNIPGIHYRKKEKPYRRSCFVQPCRARTDDTVQGASESRSAASKPTRPCISTKNNTTTICTIVSILSQPS